MQPTAGWSKLTTLLVNISLNFKLQYLKYAYIFCWNKSAAGIAWCPATALTSSEVTVLNLCTSSSHALYCTKFWEIIWNDIKVIEWTWFLYWKFQREIILQKDTISILTIYKITKWHKTETRNVTVCNKCPRRSLIMTFIPGCDLDTAKEPVLHRT